MKKAFAFALRRSLPILVGFFPVGIAYGLLMQNAGYNFLWTGACSLFVLTGSLQFLMVSFFSEGTPLTTVAVMSLLLSSRHIFYGLSFIEKFREFGPWRWFLIYALNDESYSLHCAYEPQEGLVEKWVFVFTAAIVAFYWIACSMVGALIGDLITFNTTGIDFALTALFTVILLDQLRGARTKLPAGIALISSVVCILVFGPANFILPSLLLTVAALTLLRPHLEPKIGETEVA